MSEPKPRKRYKKKREPQTWADRRASLLKNDDRGEHPLLWVDECEWSTWSICCVCNRRIRPTRGKYRPKMHEICRVSLRGSSEWLSNTLFDEDLPADEIERRTANNLRSLRYQRLMGQR